MKREECYANAGNLCIDNCVGRAAVSVWPGRGRFAQLGWLCVSGPHLGLGISLRTKEGKHGWESYTLSLW